MFALLMPAMSEAAAHGVAAAGHAPQHGAQQTQLFNWNDENKLHMDVLAPFP